MYPEGYGGVFSSRYNYVNGIDDIGVLNNILKVTGTGVIKVMPDTAEIVLGVITENDKVQTAQKENATITAQVIETLKNLGVLSKDLKTEGYTINSKYDYVDGKQVFRGYEVRNLIRVTIRDINNIGMIIDAAVEKGVNNVGNISFTINDSSLFYSEALKLAVEDAQSKAITIASKLGVKVDIIPIKIVEQTSEMSMNANGPAFKATLATTPIETGENKVSATVEAVFLLYKKV
ncbi:SIMPL domain-containing protein [Clostridium manihotivorum]|uniref:SIMPL domain-containing protein n=1 Tax=Clostridium manihotivorum TaxID=2320868 RepID=A0A3R5X2U8_9CLOT|nr:SIMPL domain-containing protein [Clostridium manihotivorum]QAA33098.1 SIMPL domain-containing protein [Clostridium manihotivorum]